MFPTFGKGFVPRLRKRTRGAGVDQEYEMRHNIRHACATWSRAVGTALGLLLFFAFSVAAQDFRAKLTVTVSDPSGLAVAGATLDLTNANSGEVVSSKTNE